MTTNRSAVVAWVIAGVAPGCAPAAVEEPTWVEDVRPILVANCVRCHGETPRNGAPETFRLDVLDDVGGRKGARSMAEFIAARTDGMNDMPADGPKLSARQKQVLANWQFTTAAGKRPDNAPPEAQVMASEPGDGATRLQLLVSDPDGDVVNGELKVEGGAQIVPLRSGMQEIDIDLTGLAAGTRGLTAIIDDGDGPISVDLGSVDVAHDNAVPRLEFTAPSRDQLLVAGETASIVFRAVDADGDGVSVSLAAVMDEQRVAIAGDVVPEQSGLGEVPLAVADVPEGDHWRIEATVSDGKSERTVRSEPFIVSHATTSDTLESMRPIINEYCRRCHSAHLPTGPNFDVPAELVRVRGIAWKKVGPRREMPPRSIAVVFPDLQLSEEDRARLAAWFYAGAPE